MEMIATKHKPLVSVVITCYNYGKYVAEAIESAKGQTYGNIEIIIINDGSTDNSAVVIKQYAKNATVIDRSNKGIIYTRNEGVSKSQGEYIIFLDADDIIPENYVERLVLLAERESADVVYSNIQMFGDESRIVNFPEITVEILKIHNQAHMSSLIRRSAISGQKFDPFLEDLSHEDWDFFLGLALKGAKIIKEPTVSLKYRIHQKGKSRNNDLKANRDKFIKTNNYIFNKYMHMYDDFLINHIEFVQGLIDKVDLEWQRLNEISNTNIVLENQNAKQKSEIDLLRLRLDAISQSIAWKVGKIVVWPASYARKLLGRLLGQDS